MIASRERLLAIAKFTNKPLASTLLDVDQGYLLETKSTLRCR
jgi:hypothetical protein